MLRLPDGLLVEVLAAVELQDWCALECADARSRDAAGLARPALRGRLALQFGQSDVWALCQGQNATALWAVLPETIPLVREGARGNTLLHAALDRPDAGTSGQARAWLAAWLLSRPGGGVLARCSNAHGQTALHLCARHGHAALAVRAARMPGVVVDARDNFEVTPLFEAVRAQRPAVVGALLAAGADPRACHGDPSRGHRSSLELAQRAGKDRMVGLFKTHCSC